MAVKKKKDSSTEIPIKRDEVKNHTNYTYLEVSAERYALGETSFIMLDLYETADHLVVEAEMPGVSEDDIKVYTSGDNLVIEGNKYERIEGEGKVNFLCMERSFGPFKRTVSIGSATDKSRIKAVYSKGILIVQIPKSKERREKTRWIEIEKSGE